MASRPRAGKLSYKLQREPDRIPERIDDLEQTVEALQHRIAELGSHEQEQESVQATLAEMQAKQEELEAAVERWAELEEMKTGSAKP
jgi:ATP-binding cassette subfamily F protein uup